MMYNDFLDTPMEKETIFKPIRKPIKKRQAYCVEQEDFTELMQWLLDDKTLKLQKEYMPAVVMYSTGYCQGYDQNVLMQYLEDYLSIKIFTVYADKEMDCIILVLA